ncbi:MAG: hypothetical protein AAGA78_05155 [Pseudomonadota bacterium]
MGATLDRLVTVLQRLWHAFKMGLLVSFVALGAAAVWFLVNAPDNDPAKALLEQLSEGAVPINALAPQDWSHACFGQVGTELRDVFRDQTPYAHSHCEGWNGPLAVYGTYAPLGFTGASGCEVIAVQRELFRPVPPGEGPYCVERKGLVHMGLDRSVPPVVTLSRR